MAIINPDGLFGGDRLRRCSNIVQLHWPRLYLAGDGFGRLELSLCTWKEDVQAAKEAARNAKNQIIEIAPWQELSSDLFRSFARSVAANHVHAVIDRRG